MNCFEARQAFVPFWRRTMPQDDRAAFLAHLRQCPPCDRSFRLFALGAPVLHSDAEPDHGSPALPRVGGLHSVASPPSENSTPRTRIAPRAWRTITAACAMAAVAALALYVAAGSPRDTLEEALAGEDQNVELTVYTPAGNLLGQDILPETDSQEPLLQEPSAIPQNDLAG